MPEITSNSNPDDPQPWFDFDVDTSNMTVGFTAANGLAADDEASADQQTEDAIVDNSRHAISVDSTKDTEIHVLAVALDGSIEFVPWSEQRPVYYAHLAEYDPETDTLGNVRTFIE